jgi:hypothetical protein
MAHFTLLRASEGLWVGVVTAAEFWALDEGRFKSINGDDGGTWNPAAPIIIGGAGLQIAGGITFSGGGTITDPVIEGTLTADDDVVLGEDATDDVTVNGTTHFTSPVFFDDDVTIGDAAADALTVNSTSNFQGPTTFTGNFVLATNGNTATIGRPLTTNALTVAGTCIIGDDGETGINITVGGAGDAITIGDRIEFDSTGIDITGTVDVTGDLTLSGAAEMAGPVALTTGHIQKRIRFINSDVDVSVADTDVVVQLSDAVANNTVNLLSTGAGEGDTITIINESRTQYVAVERDGVSLGLPLPYADEGQRYGVTVYSYTDSVLGGWRVLWRYGSSVPTA